MNLGNFFLFYLCHLFSCFLSTCKYIQSLIIKISGICLKILLHSRVKYNKWPNFEDRLVLVVRKISGVAFFHKLNNCQNLMFFILDTISHFALINIDKSATRFLTSFNGSNWFLRFCQGWINQELIPLDLLFQETS